MTWYVYGLATAVVFGVYNFLYGTVLRNVHPTIVLFGLGIGMMIVGLVVKFWGKDAGFDLSTIKWPIVVGLLVGSGMFFATRAFADPNAKVSQLIPLINSNTLITVILGLVILKEYQTAPLLKVIIGTILIVLGAVIIK